MVTRSDAAPGEGAWRAANVLLIGWILAFIDRQIIQILMSGIKASPALSDTQVSLLAGLAFALFFSLAGLPLGYLVDRVNRRRLILIGVVG